MTDQDWIIAVESYPSRQLPISDTGTRETKMSAHAAQKLFTLQDAQAHLPLVRSIVRDVVGLSKQVEQTRARLEELKKRRGDKAANDIYSEELEAIESALDEDSQRLDTYLEELIDLGIEPLDVAAGVVCFASANRDRNICLSWKYDEPVVEYWHEVDETWTSRQLIGSQLKKPNSASVNRIEAQFDESV